MFLILIDFVKKYSNTRISMIRKTRNCPNPKKREIQEKPKMLFSIDFRMIPTT